MSSNEKQVSIMENVSLITRPAIIREEVDSATRVRALLKVKQDSEAEIATILRKELDALGEKNWLHWCEKEFSWKETAAYNHLNPERIKKDRKRKRRNSDVQQPEEVDGEENTSKSKKVSPPPPWLKALGDLNEAIKNEKYSAAAIVAEKLKYFQKTGWGYDQTSIDYYVRLYNWLGELIEGLKLLTVTCDTKKKKKGE